MKRWKLMIGAGVWIGAMLAMAGCRASGSASSGLDHRGGTGSRSVAKRANRKLLPPLRSLVCLYTQRPWLNLDRAGDRDPEGIRYKVFLVAKGGTRGELRDGTFRIEMYKIDHSLDGTLRREIVSDWHYPSSDVPVIAEPGMLGDGYHLHLRWATKSLAGNEIEIITVFEEPDGNAVRSGTKRLRVPRYTS